MKILALTLIFVAFATPGHAREWESSKGGHKLQAKFLSKLGEDIKLKKVDGKVISLKLSQLSKHDQEIIRLLEKHQKEMSEATKKISRLEKDISRLRYQIRESKQLQDRTDTPRLFGRKQKSTKPNAIASFTGSGGKNTRPFTVPEGWEIQWDAKGDIFQLYLYKADGSMVGVPANQQGSGIGSSYQATAGKYYLQVNAVGRWSINIVDAD